MPRPEIYDFSAFSDQTICPLEQTGLRVERMYRRGLLGIAGGACAHQLLTLQRDRSGGGKPPETLVRDDLIGQVRNINGTIVILPVDYTKDPRVTIDQNFETDGIYTIGGKKYMHTHVSSPTTLMVEGFPIPMQQVGK